MHFIHFCQILEFVSGLDTKHRERLSKNTQFLVESIFVWAPQTPGRAEVEFKNYSDILINVYLMRLDQFLGFICGLGTKYRVKLTFWLQLIHFWGTIVLCKIKFGSEN